jgi:integrase
MSPSTPTRSRRLRDPEPGEPLGYGQGSLSWDKARPGVMVLKYAHDGRRYTERGRSWAEVDGKRQERVAALVDRQGLVEGSVAALLDGWLQATRRAKGSSLAYSTDQGYQASIAHLVGQLGDVPASELGRQHVRQALVDLAHAPHDLGRGTLHQVRYVLSMACEWGLDGDWLRVNPVRGIKLPEAAKGPREKRWFDLEGYRTVRAWLIDNPSTTSTLFQVMLDTGLRPGEANGLRWDAIDWDAGTLAVESAMRSSSTGKRAPSSTLKTDRHGDAAHRVVPLMPELVEALRAEMVRQGERSEHPFDQVTHSTLDTSAHRIAREAGVGYVNPNGYRHTFASICRHRGMPYEVLARLMGHKSVRMIISTYGHPVVDPAALDMRMYLGADAAMPYVEGDEDGLLGAAEGS